jgi:hypothetical protein
MQPKPTLLASVLSWNRQEILCSEWARKARDGHLLFDVGFKLLSCTSLHGRDISIGALLIYMDPEICDSQFTDWICDVRL